jgi:hypothetical protein
MSRSYTFSPPSAFVACSGTDLAFYENRVPRRLLEPERERKLQDDGDRDMREREER